MAESLVEKRLAGPQSVANTDTTLFTVAADHRYVVKQIILTNTDTVTRTVSIAIGATATVGNRFVSDLSLIAGEIVILDTALVLEAAETLIAIASVSSVLNALVTGWDHALL